MKNTRGLAQMNTAPLHERVYKELRQAIIRGHFVPGQAITIRALARTFGTSNMPVRDALTRLLAERAVEMPNSRSFRIPMLIREEFEELCTVRVLLECHAVRLACRSLDERCLTRLDELDAAVARHFRSGDYESALEANAELLFTLYGTASHGALLAHIEALWLQSGPYLVKRMHQIGRSSDYKLHGAVGHHRELLAALHAHDGRAAAAALRMDIEETRSSYVA